MTRLDRIILYLSAFAACCGLFLYLTETRPTTELAQQVEENTKRIARQVAIAAANDPCAQKPPDLQDCRKFLAQLGEIVPLRLSCAILAKAQVTVPPKCLSREFVRQAATEQPNVDDPNTPQDEGTNGEATPPPEQGAESPEVPDAPAPNEERSSGTPSTPPPPTDEPTPTSPNPPPAPPAAEPEAAEPPPGPLDPVLDPVCELSPVLC